MEESMNTPDAIKQALADFENMVIGLYIEPEAAYDRIVSELDPELAPEFDRALEQQGFAEVADSEEMFDTNSDEELMKDFGDAEFEESFDLNNGYDENHFAVGSDYFPNGADSSVVKSTGPSGARQGDNPEQKKMKVDEVHKELIYSYRSFLAEETKKKE